MTTEQKEWKHYSVEDLIKDGKLLIGDGYRAKNSELASSGLPFARAGNVNNGFVLDNADFFLGRILRGLGISSAKPEMWYSRLKEQSDALDSLLRTVRTSCTRHNCASGGV